MNNSLISAVSQRSRLSGVIALFLAATTASCGSDSAPVPQSQTTPQSAATTASASNASGQVLLGDVTRVDSVIAQHQGRWILVNVWATWCRPCVAETPDLVALHQSLKDKPFSLIGISADYMTSPTAQEAVSKVQKFGLQHQIQFPNVVFSGSTDDLTARFALGGTIPTSILYDPQGKEVERWTGRLAEDDFTRIRAMVL